MKTSCAPATALIACGALLSLAASTMSLAADASSTAPATGDRKPSAATPNPRTAMTGQWSRYPEIDEKPLPAFPPPPPIPPAPLKARYKAEWEARRKAVADAEAAGKPLYSNYTACLPDGMPAMMMGMFPMEVLQTPGQITIIQEAYNQVRRVYLNAQLPAFEEAEPLFWGHSSGKWEGDTLVVETIGIKEDVRFRDVPHSNQMRIMERLRLLSPTMMEDLVTVTDPVYLDGPWQFKWMYKRMPGYHMLEYVCESNREYRDETGAARMRIGK
ncbi:MAG: hypothetical protein WDO56_00835 [Gammaproteobacteria bacterium]